MSAVVLPMSSSTASGYSSRRKSAEASQFAAASAGTGQVWNAVSVP